MLADFEVLDKAKFLQDFKNSHKLTHSRIAQLTGASEQSVARWFGSFHKSKTPTQATCKLLWLLDYLDKQEIDIPPIPDFE
jgi:hypothetical protein